VDFSAELLGPLGALIAALAAVRVLWTKLQTAEARIQELHQARLEDARKTREALLAVYDRLLTPPQNS
jgi:hypothetical protein